MFDHRAIFAKYPGLPGALARKDQIESKGFGRHLTPSEGIDFRVYVEAVNVMRSQALLIDKLEYELARAHDRLASAAAEATVVLGRWPTIGLPETENAIAS